MSANKKAALITSRDRQGVRITDLFAVALDRAKLTGEEAQLLISRGGEFQAHVLAGIKQFAAKQPDYGLAQSILGADFITPAEVTKARPSIVYTVEQITALAESLPSEEVLKWCKENGYAVMPAPPTAMSTLDVREIQSAHFYSKTGGWYADQQFARQDKTSFGWLLIKKTPVSDSTSKTWNEQNKLLSALEKVPNAAEMSWFITTYFEVRGVRLFEGIYVRTSSLVSDGYHVYVGFFDAKGLGVYRYWAYYRYDFLGLAAARKTQ